ncbi:MAG: hypothetical protein ABIH46_03270, partial [Chloroflexota bacterium]
MIETIAIAAGKFAARLASQWAGDALKRQSIEKAYREVAEAAIKECERCGHHGRSPIWNELVDLLGNVTRVESALKALRQSAVVRRSRVLDRYSTEARELFRLFVACLNERLGEELSTEHRVQTDIDGARFAALAERIEELKRPVRRLSDLGLTWYEERRLEGDLTDTQILSAYAMSIDLVGRDREMEELKGWLDTDVPTSIHVRVGRAGSGKTRLAL